MTICQAKKLVNLWNKRHFFDIFSKPDLESQIPNLSILRDARRHLLQLPAAAASSRIVFNKDDRGNRSLHQLFNLSTFFDASERTEAKNDANDVNKIPVRATLLSSIIVFPYLVVYGLSYCLNMTDYNRAVMNRLALTICNALRSVQTGKVENLLSLIWTFLMNEANQGI